MQTIRKCEQCNTLNENQKIYCVNCGKYLRGKVSQKESKLTIWGIDATPSSDSRVVVQTQKTGQTGSEQVVVCPECLSKCPVKDGVLPLSCAGCGYFFQAGIDEIVNVADLVKRDMKKDAHAAGKTPAGVQNTPVVSLDGPLKSVACDNTSLRITSLTSHTFLPEMMKEAGNIIGKNGTAFRGFVSNKQVSIWHTSSGWYARATIGTPLHNGVPMNQGVQKKLSAGDLLIMDQEQFMVEII